MHSYNVKAAMHQTTNEYLPDDRVYSGAENLELCCEKECLLDLS